MKLSKWRKFQAGGVYSIKAGDSLSKIAAQNKVSVNQLLRVNPSIKNPDLIYADQKISLPGKSEPRQQVYQDWNRIKDRNQAVNSLPDDHQKLVSHHSQDPDRRYIVVDKKNAKMNLYQGSKLIKAYEVGIGKLPGDAQTVTKFKDGKVNWDAGNQSTGAGVYTISNIDPHSKTYYGLPSFNLKNDRGIEVATSIHAAPAARRSKFSNNDDRDNRMSYGCINGQEEDLKDLYRQVDLNTPVYILPEDEGNQFEIVDNQPVFRVDAKNRAKYESYTDLEGNTQKGQGANSSINTLKYAPIRPKFDTKRFKEQVFQWNDTNDEQELKDSTEPFYKALSTRKRDVMLAAGISSDTYNEIAKMAFGIYGTESNFGDTHSALGNLARAGRKWNNPKSSSSPDYKSKATTYGANEDFRSIGLTQMRWQYLNDDEIAALRKVGIESNIDILDPESAAVATATVLGVRYNQQLNPTQKKDIWGNLPQKWNTRENYPKRVKENAEYLNFEQLAPEFKNNAMGTLKFQMGGYTPTQLTDAKFIPTYVGTPLDDAKVYGTDVLNTYKQNIADLTKLDIQNAQRKVTEGDKPESAKYDAELKAQFEDMAKKGDYENMSSQVNELARRHFNNKKLKAFAETYTEAQKREEDVRKLRLQGTAPLFDLDPQFHQTVVTDENGNETYNIYRYSGEAPLDYQAEKAKIWSVIQADMAPLSESPDEVSKVLHALPGYLASGEWKGISGGKDSKIAKLLDSAITAYRQTPQYDQEIRKEMFNNPSMSKEDAEKLMTERVLAEGMLKTFSQKGVQMYQNWKMRHDMENESDESTRVLDLETGIKFKDIPQFKDAKIETFDPKRSTALEEMRKRGDSPRYGGDPQQYKQYEAPNYERGTPEQRSQYEAISKAVIEKDYPEGTLDEFYKDGTAAETAANTEKEKQFLYSQDVYDRVQEYTKHVEDKLFYNTITSFASTPKGQQQQQAATKGLQNNFHRKVFYNFATGEVISPEDKGQINPKFQDIVPDVSKLEVNGHTAGINPYGKITNDPRFYNSDIAVYYDPDEKQFQKFLVADNIYKSDPELRNLSDLWATGTQQPFQVVKYKTLNGHDVEFKDEENKGIRVYKVNGHELTGKDGKSGIVVSNYEDFYNALSKL